MIEYRFSLELTKNGIQKSIHAKAGEIKGRKLVITLTESGEIYNVGEEFKARVFFEDNTYSDDVKIIDNRIHFELPSGLVSKSGVRICEVKLYLKDDTTVIYSPMFEIVAEKSFGSEADAQALRPTVKYQELIANTGIKKSEMNDNDMIVIFDSENGVVMRFAWKDMKDALGGHTHENAATLGALSEADGQLTYNGSAVGEKPYKTAKLQNMYCMETANQNTFHITDEDWTFEPLNQTKENPNPRIEIKTIRIKHNSEMVDIHRMNQIDNVPYCVNLGGYISPDTQSGLFAIVTFGDFGLNTIFTEAYAKNGFDEIEVDYYE